MDQQVEQGRQRIGPLTHVPAVLKELGADPAQVLRTAGLSADALADPDESITYLTVGRLLQASVACTGCAHVGLRVGRRATLDSLGDVGWLVRTAPDVRTAMMDLITSQHKFARGAITYFRVLRDSALFGYAVYQPGVAALDQIADLVAAFGCNCLREIANARPDEILLAHSAPADIGPYKRLLSSPVRFDSEQTALIISLKRLAQSNPKADPTVHAEMEHRVGRLRPDSESDVKTRLRRLLWSQTAMFTPRIEATAEQLSVHPRTLNRRLREEGTSFREALNEVRFETARQLLGHTRLGVTQIAIALGYAEPGVFTRAFRRWAGVAPSEWRVAHRRA